MIYARALTCAAVVSFLTVGTAGRAIAAQRELLVLNEGNAAIFNLRIAHAARNDWGGDLLGFNQVIDVSSGRELHVRFDRSACKYDVQATYGNGDVVVKHGVNLCHADHVSFSH